MNQIALIIPLAIGIFSCSQVALEDKVVELQQENKQLLESSIQKDQSLTDFLTSFTDIEKNLAEIRERELNINLSNGDASSTVAINHRVVEDIKVINELMVESKQTIEELNLKINKVSGKNTKLRKALNLAKKELVAQIEERDIHITLLNRELQVMDSSVQQLNGQVENLTLANSDQEQVIQNQTGQIQTAYYTTGTSKELVAGNILAKDGGFLGLGKTEKLKNDFNSDQFNKIDISVTTTIPINGSKVELVTSHPTDSYMFEGDIGENIDRLVIIDPNRFWNSSKYLVVVTN